MRKVSRRMDFVEALRQARSEPSRTERVRDPEKEEAARRKRERKAARLALPMVKEEERAEAT